MRNFFVLFAFICQLLAPISSPAYSKEKDKTVLISILARNKAHLLPKYLECIENLEYDKSLISLYINTNNNVDNTKELLEEWLEKHQSDYRAVIFDAHELSQFDSNKPHDWTFERFKVLGKIRDKSLQMTKELDCDYYFTADCDNFIQPYTLQVLMHQNKPIIAPLLHSIPEPNDPYSNYFCAISKNGYYMDHPDYKKILTREKLGTFKVPVVHCTYLIKAEYIDDLTYSDGTNDYEFVIFSRSARKNKVGQYICNEFVFGDLVHFHDFPTLEEEKLRMNKYFEENCID